MEDFALYEAKFISIWNSNLSELKMDDKFIYIPDFLRDEASMKSKYKISEWDLVCKKRQAAFRECKLVEYDLPMIETTFTNLENIEADWKDSSYFVKTCFMSPKDIKAPPIFSSPKEAILALKNSERTRELCHIVLKKVKDFEDEFRCFWIREKLRFVISKTELTFLKKKSILDSSKIKLLYRARKNKRKNSCDRDKRFWTRSFLRPGTA